jgi:hypothetical protein
MSGGAKCWKCTRCGWVDCYSAEDLAEYGEPTECQDNYHESLVEIDLVKGRAALADKATIEVRKANRALKDAEALATRAERDLHQAIAAREAGAHLDLGLTLPPGHVAVPVEVLRECQVQAAEGIEQTVEGGDLNNLFVTIHRLTAGALSKGHHGNFAAASGLSGGGSK